MPAHDRLHEALHRFATTIAGEYDVSDVLLDVCDHGQELAGCAGAGLSVLDDEGRFCFASASSAAVALMEEAQEQAHDGPCRDALAAGRAVMIADLRADGRWPEYVSVAESNGLTAVLAVPLLHGRRGIGVLDLYDAAPRSWSGDDVATATLLAEMATAYVLRADATARIEQVNRQLQGALESRVVIEQAKGRLAGELDLTVDEAFGLIRAHARANNRRLRDVAEDVMAGTLSVLELGES